MDNAWPKWPLAIGAVLWVGVGVAIYRGLWWPLWVAAGIGIVAALGGGILLVMGRRSISTARSMATPPPSQPHKKPTPKGVSPRNRKRRRR